MERLIAASVMRPNVAFLRSCSCCVLHESIVEGWRLQNKEDYRAIADILREMADTIE